MDVAALDARLRKAEVDAARARVEIERVGSALAEAEDQALGQPTLALRVNTAAEVTLLEQSVVKQDADAAELRSLLAHKQAKLKFVQEMLDAREAELYETEEAVRELEGREAARSRELDETRSQLARAEARLLARQAEAARAAQLAEEQLANQWREPMEEVKDAVRRGLNEAPDPDAEARALRLAKTGKVDPAAAGYTQFHTLVMGVKLAAGPENVAVNNLAIDEMWEEVCGRRVPRSEWRALVHEKALQAKKAEAAAKAKAATAIRDALVDALVATPGKALLRSVSKLVDTTAAAAHELWDDDVAGAEEEAVPKAVEPEAGSAGSVPARAAADPAAAAKSAAAGGGGGAAAARALDAEAGKRRGEGGGESAVAVT